MSMAIGLALGGDKQAIEQFLKEDEPQMNADPRRVKPKQSVQSV